MPRESRRDAATKTINQLRAIFQINWLTPYQVRIEDAIDLYPTNLRYFVVATKDRGYFPSTGLETWIIDKISSARRGPNMGENAEWRHSGVKD